MIKFEQKVPEDYSPAAYHKAMKAYETELTGLVRIDNGNLGLQSTRYAHVVRGAAVVYEYHPRENIVEIKIVGKNVDKVKKFISDLI